VLKQRYTDNQNGMDVAVLAYQKNNAQTHLTFAGAKINLLYYLTETADFHHVKGTRKSIGGAQEHYITFDNYDLVLPQGTCLYIGSDGLADQNNVRRERFKPSRIEKILADNVSHPMFYQQTCLEESLLAYMTGTVQRDDILFMGVRL
jgi:serine phosphatase RsbU (regulator of sigma subunit)